MITDIEAERLLRLLKELVVNRPIAFPPLKAFVTLEAVAPGTNEQFQIDIVRKTLHVRKCTYQTRHKKSVPLLRVDIGGPPHTNPDGVEIPCPHIHVYKENYEDKWAYPLHMHMNTDPDDLVQVLIDFLEYNNVTNPPNVIRQVEVTDIEPS